MATQQARNNNVWLAPLLAGLLGAGVALLFAPRSGKETRKMLQDQADDLKHQAEDKVHDVRESLSQSMDEAMRLKDRLTEAIDSGRQTLKENKDKEPEQDKPKAPAAQSSVLSTWEEEV